MKTLLKILVVSTVAAVSQMAQALDVGDQVSCITLRDRQPDGSVVEQCANARADVAEFTIVEFFSIQCGACLRNLPVLESLATDVESKATTRLISVDRDVAAVDAFLNTSPMKLRMAYDNERLAKRHYEIVVTPTIFVIDRDDKIVYRHAGSLIPSDVAAIKGLVGGN